MNPRAENKTTTAWFSITAWNPNDAMTYTSYANGFDSGGFSETCRSPRPACPTSEDNQNCEIGMKSDLLDGALRLNVALFHTKYGACNATRWSQSSTPLAISSRKHAVNDGESTANGIEIELTRCRWKSAINFTLGPLTMNYDTQPQHKSGPPRAARPTPAS